MHRVVSSETRTSVLYDIYTVFFIYNYLQLSSCVSDRNLSQSPSPVSQRLLAVNQSPGMLPEAHWRSSSLADRRCPPVNHVDVTLSYVTRRHHSTDVWHSAKKKKNTVAGVMPTEVLDTSLPKMKNDGAVPCRRHSVFRSRSGSFIADDVLSPSPPACCTHTHKQTSV